MKKEILLVCRALLFVVLLFVSVTCISQTKNLSEKARNMNPLPNKCLVYLFQNGSTGGGIKVYINSKDSITLFYKQFSVYSLEPGKYAFTGSGENEDDLFLTLEANTKYFIAIEDKPSFTQLVVSSDPNRSKSRCNLKQYDTKKGANCVKKCNLLWMNSEAKTMVYGN